MRSYLRARERVFRHGSGAPAHSLYMLDLRRGNRIPLAEPPSRHPSAPLGGYLRERREQLGLEVRALHEHTRIRHHYLEAIEAERFAALPSDLILREYVRQVAQALAIVDPVEYARRFVAKAHAVRCGVALASGPPPARPIPWAEDLLAEFDFEPELEALEPEPVRLRP